MPELKPKAKGSLTVDNHGIAFSAKSGRYDVPWAEIAAVSSANERVELWGTTGRIVRMVIPNGGGLAAATVMHHKVNELTVEFHDIRGAYHGAVFFLPAADAAHVMESSTLAVPSLNDPIAMAVSAPKPSISCQGASGLAGAVLVSPPTWTEADVPAAYRAAVYEHIIDRLKKVQGVTHVYRAGEPDTQPVCPQFTISISVVSFKPGNQVARASMGPIGFFAKTTQLVFDATITDVSGHFNKTEPLKATVRGESESLTIADSVAKRLAKLYVNDLKQFNRGGSLNAPTPPHAL
ncbi:hypothetical protein [Terriglobus sp. RCC_193]|uniref:hypothetical protein n=1 Tax=Terriglobus sp. RCC_193 TaxID=3239218 RepID=UPI0035259A64